MNDADRSEQAKEKLAQLAKVLSISSLNQYLSEAMIGSIAQGRPYSETCGDKCISLVIEKWPNHRFNGYDLKFVISSI